VARKKTREVVPYRSAWQDDSDLIAVVCGCAGQLNHVLFIGEQSTRSCKKTHDLHQSEILLTKSYRSTVNCSTVMLPFSSNTLAVLFQLINSAHTGLFGLQIELGPSIPLQASGIKLF
jgi:hypothetical protein